jgi:hypothetical protein
LFKFAFNFFVYVNYVLIFSLSFHLIVLLGHSKPLFQTPIQTKFKSTCFRVFSSFFFFLVVAAVQAAETENDAAHAAQNLRLGGSLPLLEFSDEGATDFTIVTASTTSRAASARSAIGTADNPIEVDEEDVVPIPVTVDTVEHGNTNPLFPGDFYFPGLEEDFSEGRLDATEEETPNVARGEDSTPAALNNMLEPPVVSVEDSKPAALNNMLEPPVVSVEDSKPAALNNMLEPPVVSVEDSKPAALENVVEPSVVSIEDSKPAAKKASNPRSKKRKAKGAPEEKMDDEEDSKPAAKGSISDLLAAANDVSEGKLGLSNLIKAAECISEDNDQPESEDGRPVLTLDSPYSKNYAKIKGLRIFDSWIDPTLPLQRKMELKKSIDSMKKDVKKAEKKKQKEFEKKQKNTLMERQTKVNYWRRCVVSISYFLE